MKPEIGDEVAGYREEGFIGYVVTGPVYRAGHIKLGREVALHILSSLGWPLDLRESLEELKAAATFEHPHVVPIYEVGETGWDCPFIAKRPVGGTDLKIILDREGPLAAAPPTRLLAQAAGALDAAHERGLLHADLNPLSVRVAADSGHDHAYIDDLGLLAVASRAVQDPEREWPPRGNVAYVAPEQLRGEKVDGRTDVYALGCVLYELLAGEPPFARDTSIQTLWAIVSEPPPRLTSKRPELPAVLDAVLARALAKAPEERYPSAGELARAAAEAVGRGA